MDGMNGPAPGWQPDPTGRHEYRYWDGTRWSDDVSDGGVAATDPVGGAPDATQQQAPSPTQPQGYGAAPGGQVPPTTPQPTYQAGYDPSGYDAGAAGGAGASYGSGGYGATGGSGPGTVPSGGYGTGFPDYGGPAAARSSGPSTGLLVGLGALVVLLIAGIAFVLLSDDDGDDTATDDATTTTQGATDPTDATTTLPPDDGGDDGGDDGDSGSSDAIVTGMAEAIVSGSGGAITQEQAECMSQAMIDELGLDRLVELGLEANSGSGDPLASMTAEEQDAVYGAMIPCMGGGDLPPIGGT
jgi:hypothetical protein